MRRYTILTILTALFVVMLAACTDDAPTDISGCVAEEGQPTDEVYSSEFGCLNGVIISHGEDAEAGEHTEESESEDHSVEGENASGEDTTADDTQSEGG